MAAKEKQPTPIATFQCWIPQIKSAILFGQGAQIKLEAADDAEDEILKLVKHGKDRVLNVVIFAADT